MIKEENDLKIENDGDAYYSTNIIQDNKEFLKDAYYHRMFGNNGFSKMRELQYLGTVPIVAYLKGCKDGYDFDDESDVDRFFKDNPEFLACNPWVTPGSNAHKIIIK